MGYIFIQKYKVYYNVVKIIQMTIGLPEQIMLFITFCMRLIDIMHIFKFTKNKGGSVSVSAKKVDSLYVHAIYERQVCIN